MGFDSPYPDIVALFKETVSKRNRRKGSSTVEIEASKALGCGFKSRSFLKKRRLLKLMAEVKKEEIAKIKILKTLREKIRRLNSKLDMSLFIKKTGDETTLEEIEFEKKLIKEFYRENKDLIEMMRRNGELK